MKKDDIEYTDKALEKLKQLLDAGDAPEDVVVFDKQEAEALREVAKAWAAAKGFVWIAGTVGNSLKWFLAFSAAWAAFKFGLFDWIKAGIGK